VKDFGRVREKTMKSCPCFLNGRVSSALAILAAAMAVPGLLRAESLPGAPDRDTLEKWIETQRLISMEKQDWRTGRELLEERTELVQREIASFREKTAQATNDIGEADLKLAEMKAENDELKTATEGLEAAIVGLEARVQDLLARSPEPIRQRVKPLSQRIPKNPAETETGMPERFQNVIGILNEMNKFCREITEASEVRDLPDGSSAEVSVLYLGLGQAYYCNLNGGVAGVGRPAEEGWAWEPLNPLAPSMAEVLAVHRNEKPAVYVPLPVEIQ
jgi:hypothetical protein